LALSRAEKRSWLHLLWLLIGWSRTDLCHPKTFSLNLNKENGGGILAALFLLLETPNIWRSSTGLAKQLRMHVFV
jgi:hypothetical protein